MKQIKLLIVLCLLMLSAFSQALTIVGTLPKYKTLYHINKNNYSRTQVDTTFLNAGNRTSSDITSAAGSLYFCGDSYYEQILIPNKIYGFVQQVALNILTSGSRNVNLGTGYYTQFGGNVVNITQWNDGITSDGTNLKTYIRLATGKKITITNRRYNYANFFYRGSNAAGNIEVRRNGVLVATQVLTTKGDVLYSGQIKVSDSLTNLTDTITLTSTGLCDIRGIQSVKKTNNSPYIYIRPQSGSGWQDYVSNAVTSEIALGLNTTTGANKTLVFSLGINNLRASAAKALSPKAMVANMTISINSIISKVTGKLNVVITIPPTIDETRVPVTSGFNYTDYVSAMVVFCTTNGYSMIRLDQTPLGTYNSANNAGDGIHLNLAGNKIAEQKTLEALFLIAKK